MILPPMGSSFRILMLVCTLGLTACSNAPTYTIDHAEDTDFSAFRNFQWYDDVHPSKEAKYRHYNSSDKRVRESVNLTLKDKGLRLVNSGSVDFWVNYHISKENHMRIDSFSGYGNEPGAFGGASVGTYGSSVTMGYSSGSHVKEYKEGTVVIDVIDSSSSQVVWRGIAEGRLPQDISRTKRDSLAEALAKEILSDFPPQ